LLDVGGKEAQRFPGRRKGKRINGGVRPIYWDYAAKVKAAGIVYAGRERDEAQGLSILCVSDLSSPRMIISLSA
jgi:hypothetical protein